MKQNVSGAAAFIAIFVTIGLLFAVFSKPAPEPVDNSVSLPEVPQISDVEVRNMAKGLEPLGIVTVLPPILEDRAKGVRVSMVYPNTAAQKAGMLPTDLITAFNGHELVSKDPLIEYLTQVSPDKTYPMVVNRSGQKLTLQVTGLKPLTPEERVK